MDPVTLIVIPGLVGGIVIAVVAFLRQGRAPRHSSLATASRPEPPSTDIINVASIKVAGIGGLGLVAMAAAVALNVPRIGQTLGIGLVLGVTLATVMIALRRRTGSMPSSGQQPGANTILAIDATDAAADATRHETARPLDLVIAKA